MRHMDFFKKVVENKQRKEQDHHRLLHSIPRKRILCPLQRETFHVVDKPFKADIHVYFTKNEHEADLLVYVSNFRRSSKNRSEVWFYSKSEHCADTKIYPVSRKFMADVVVCIVEHEYKARWIRRKQVKLRNRKIGV